MIIDEIVATHGGQVVRVNSDMRAPRNIEDIFLESNTGRFPHLARTYDPMITFLIILELAAREGTPLSDLKERLPRSNLTWTSIPCSMDDKAALMRVLSADAGSDKIQMIDGVRIVRGDAWILVLPDASQPLIHLYAEAKENEARDALIEEYTHRIKTHKGVAK
jgi:mannose-1-phosphate guanylyltransferase/phosphomannomutase